MKKVLKKVFGLVICSVCLVSQLAPLTNVYAEDGLKMWRLYNPNTGEHFYTSSTTERDNVYNAGWNIEGYGWISPSSSNTPVYRVYNPYEGDHHYTTSVEEKNHLVSVGWRDEGIGWYASDSQTSTVVYREYNPNARTGTHNFTTNLYEHNNLISVGWRDEGVAFYALGAGTSEGAKDHWYGFNDMQMQNAVNAIGTQIDQKYGSKSYMMCSAYSIALLRSAMFGDNREPATYWTDNGGAHWAWGGGTDHRGADVITIARNQLKIGRAVIIHTTDHYVVAYGFSSPGNKLSDFKVLDPWSGYCFSLGGYNLQGDGQIITF